MKIPNRTFIISGGSSGLGLSATNMILHSGGNVAILDRQEPPPELAARVYAGHEDIGNTSHRHLLVAEKPSRVIYIPTDITKPAQVTHSLDLTVEWAKETSFPLGGVLHGAGIALAEMSINLNGKPHSEKVWDRVLGVNLNGTFQLTRLALPHLIQVEPEGEDGERGVIIMISSSAAFEGQIGQIAYSASKGALLSMTLPLARDLAKYGIRVITLAPGPFTTPMTDQFSKKIENSLKKNAMLFPRRYGDPREFSATVKWCIECAYINGENYRLSGGVRVPAWL